MSAKQSAVATPPVDAPAISALGFPSSEAVARIRELADVIKKLKIELAAAERALALASKNRDLLGLTGGDPDEAVRRAKAAVDFARAKLSGTKNEFARAFIATRDECEKARSASWAITYQQIVVPRAAKIASAIDAFERTVDEIVSLLNPDSETVRQLDALDSATDRWNKFVSELGGPGNASINVSAGLKTIWTRLTQSANVRRLETALQRLREAANPPPAKAPLQTEEKLVAEREAAAEKELFESSKIKAQAEIADSKRREDLKSAKF